MNQLGLRLTDTFMMWLRAILVSTFIALIALIILPANPTSAQTPIGSEFNNFGGERDQTEATAWGDWDGDGDLDLAVGNRNGLNQVYENVDGELQISERDGLGWSFDSGQRTYSLAWGDWDGDGDLDLAAGNKGENQVYENQNGTLAFDPPNGLGWASAATDNTATVSWGDWDGDGDLDLAVGNTSASNRVYENDSGTLLLDPTNGLGWESETISSTYSIAWADWDGDGDLDLAVGNNGVNQVYENNQGNLQLDPASGLGWESTGDAKSTKSLAWGDWDNDGDLDLAVGNDAKRDRTCDCLKGGATQVYENSGDGLGVAPIWMSESDSNESTSVAWGDWDSDGDLDLAVGNSSSVAVNQVYENLGTQLATAPAWTSTARNELTNSIAWGDLDNDGDLDLAVGRFGQFNLVYENTHGSLATTPAWESTGDERNTYSVAWGDADGDGDLDLAVGNYMQPTQIYESDGMTLTFDPLADVGWESGDGIQIAYDAAWGDLNSDNKLDLAVARFPVGSEFGLGPGSPVLFSNGDDGLTSTPAWQPANIASDRTTSVAWGDWDNDGDLDLAVGYSASHVNEVYENSGGTLNPEPVWESTDDEKWTQSLAWGDWDNDGDLDLAVGNTGDVNQVYENIGGDLVLDPANQLGWESTGNRANTLSVAWGDWDGDGDLDLAFGNDFGNLNQVYENLGDTLADAPAWQAKSSPVLATFSVAWADWDGDGDLDLAVGNQGDYESDCGCYVDGKNHIYENTGSGLSLTPVWQSSDGDKATLDLAWGDWDGDGDPDLAAGNNGQVNQIFVNGRQGTSGLPNNSPWIRVSVPNPLASADFYASATIIDDPIIAIPFTLFDLESDFVGRVEGWYSLNGGGQWFPAVATPDTVLTDLPASPSGETYTFQWDTLASNLFGQSDNVIFRVTAYLQPDEVGTGVTYSYTNSLPGLYQRPQSSSGTFPFRVQGSQVRVFDGIASPEQAVSDALVYRIAAGQSVGEALSVGTIGQADRTNGVGYLTGRSPVGIGDQLVALLPVSNTNFLTFTQNADLYYTNATPTTDGLDAYTVTESGVQDLVVSADNPLLLFNLDLSLEWDARNDPVFLEQLERDLKRTSEILYDLTNGQAALGDIQVYHDKERWLDAHIVVHATNSLRPSANLGGIIDLGVDDVISATTVITNAYLPGQVRMGSVWNRFGNIEGNRGEDWPRVLAHELGHYLFFLLDNYLGLSEDELLIEVDCQGSAMTDPYVDGYSEFLNPNQWTGDCLRTVAERTTSRSDWETLTTFYPMLDGGSPENPGPNTLPLAVTQISFVEPVTPTTALETPFFSLVDSGGQRLSPDRSQTRGYLYKTGVQSNATDDQIVALGAPNQDQLHAPGTEPGDRICIFDYGHTPTRIGCINEVGLSESAIALAEVPNWEPRIDVTPINSVTLAITVSQVSISGTDSLNVQVLSEHGVASLPLVLEPINDERTEFSRIVSLRQPSISGYVRVWVDSGNESREFLTQYALGSGWSGLVRAWPGLIRAWPGLIRAWPGLIRAWPAPITSSDGQVTIFNSENILDDDTTYQLQSFLTLQSLPPWLTPVGQAYRFETNQPTEQTSISFNYLERDVPPGEEQNVQIYYSVDGEVPWTALETEQDGDRNLATARTRGNGVYALLVTRQIDAFSAGWNMFGYPIQDTRPISVALASIEGKYTHIYRYEPESTPHWLLYTHPDDQISPAFASAINTLTHLSHGKGYWIRATESVTPSFGVSLGDGNIRVAQLNNDEPPPPATYYGWILPTESFAPKVGMTVRAHIDGANCGDAGVQEIDGQLAYILHVRQDICDVQGKTVQFALSGKLLDADRVWDNGKVWFHPLEATPKSATETQQPLNKYLYLPFVQ